MKTTITLRLNTARPCRSMICEAFLRLVDGSVDGFGNRQVVNYQAAGLILGKLTLGQASINLQLFIFKS